MKRVITLSLVTSSMLFASGYRVPEQSLNATALCAAYVANANGADASYYNPANMVFNDNINQIDAGLTYVELSGTNYNDNRSPLYSGKSTIENILIPTFHFSSKEYQKNIRYGLSLTVPGGLTKRWDAPFAKTFAKEFSLKIVELNPTIAYKVSDQFAIGAGFRAISSEGVVKSAGAIPVAGSRAIITRDMEGDTFEFGYNVAMTYKPKSNLTLSATYRSNVDLKEEGDAKLYSSAVALGAGSSIPSGYYDGGSDVTVPLPAVLSLAAAYDFGDTTVEFEFDRTYWSTYEDLDFEYSSPVLNPILAGAFDDSKDKSWKDVSAYRIGITHKYNDVLTLMAGFGIDKNPIPSKTLSFELPDSDARLHSIGCKFKYSENLDMGLAFLYTKKENRKVVNDVLNGTFTDSKAYLLTAGISYKF